MRLSVRGIEREGPNRTGPSAHDQTQKGEESKRTRRLKKAISREKKKKREEEVVVVVVVVGGGGEVEEVKLMIDLCGELLRRKRKRSLSVDGNQYAGGGKTRRRGCSTATRAFTGLLRDWVLCIMVLGSFVGSWMFCCFWWLWVGWC